jgi:YbgC/YbaW family acyl-CoA thioester hydrolase
VTTFPTVDCTVYPYECDAFGHLNEAAFLAVFERARWESLARGPGMDVFRRSGVWPAVRKATIEYRAGAYPGDVLRVETLVSHRGTTSFTLKQVATRVRDGALISEAVLVFVCIDSIGRATPIPEEIAKLLGPRTGGAGGRAGGGDLLRIEVGGAELAVEVRGEGLPVLFVHGFPFDRSMWKHQLATLARYKRIAPDLRGAGASTAPDDGYSMSRYADDLVAVLDAAGVERAVVCGLSMGGYVTFELLRRHPERVQALILCDTKAEADLPQGRRDREELAALARSAGAAAVAERLVPTLLAPATHAAQPEVVQHVRAMIEGTSVAGIVGALHAMRDRPDSTALLPQIHVPTLVLGGADDQIAPPAGMQAMAAAIPGSQFATVPSAGHLAPLEQPFATSRRLADFLGTLA